MSSIYKGYLRANGKVPAVKIKDAELIESLYDASFTNSDIVGVLKESVIMVDFDDPREYEKMWELVQGEEIKCRVVRTSRGGHFYFRVTDTHVGNKTHTNTPIGFHVDIKLGSKNTVDPIKFGGTFREVDADYEYEELDVIPFWLDPMTRGKDLNGSEGRNSSSFSYILPLQGEGYSKEQIRELIRLINSYILDEPLNDTEIDTILRDEAFSKPAFVVKGRFMHDVFAEFVVKEEGIFRIAGDDSGRVYINRDGEVIGKRIEIQKLMIKHMSGLTMKQIVEVEGRVGMIAPVLEISEPNYILCANGVLDINTDTVRSVGNDVGIITNKISYDYDSGAYDAIVDKTLNKIACGDKSVRKLLEEVVGFCMYRRNELGKSFFLVGDGSNGKSTFIKMITKLLGRSNVSTIDIEDLGSRFKAMQVQGKLCNIGDDIGNGFISDVKTFKKLVTGDAINVEKKGLDAYDLYDVYCKFVFSCNDIPKLGDASGGIMRRIEIIPFNANFKRGGADGEEYDEYIVDKLTTRGAMEYLLRIGIEGLKRVLAGRGFTEIESSIRAKEEFELDNNPIMRFVQEYDKGVEGDLVANVYLSYKIWCVDFGFKYVSINNFGAMMKSKYGLISKQKSINGKIVRIYVKS